MPDILLEIVAGLYFYMRDDKRIGLSFECECGKSCYPAFTIAQLSELLHRAVGRLVADNAHLRETVDRVSEQSRQHEQARQQGWNEANALRPLKELSEDECRVLLDWLEHGDKHDDEDCGMHRRVTLPEESFVALVEHLKRVSEVQR